MKEKIIILSHGSRRKKSQVEFMQLIDRLRKNYDISNIEPAYLNFGKPGLEDKVKELNEEGIKVIKVFPLFLFSGYHLDEDIPAKLSSLSDEYPNIKFVQMEHIGANVKFVELIAEHLDAK